jgi:hypothetical protein
MINSSSGGIGTATGHAPFQCWRALAKGRVGSPALLKGAKTRSVCLWQSANDMLQVEQSEREVKMHEI